jgi:hypothetical protein
MVPADAFHRNDGELLPAAQPGDTSAGAGGAGMFTVSATSGLQGPYPIGVHACTCH